jgi:hypothetical protein
MYSPVKLHAAPLTEIEADLRRIHAELAPCDIVMADIQWTTPDARVNELLQVCRMLESESCGKEAGSHSLPLHTLSDP